MPPDDSITSPQPSIGTRPTSISDSQLIELFSDPNRSLVAVAADLGLSLHDLTLHLARPDVMQLLTSVENVAAFRTRFIATSHLSTVVASLVDSIRALETADEAPAKKPTSTQTHTPTPTPTPTKPEELTALEFTRRRHETSRRACALLIRLARFAPLPPNARQAERQTTRQSQSQSQSQSQPQQQPAPSAAPPNTALRPTDPAHPTEPFTRPPQQAPTKNLTPTPSSNPASTLPNPRPNPRPKPRIPSPHLSARQRRQLDRAHLQTTSLPQPAS